MVNFKSSGFDKGTGGKSGKFQFDCDNCILFTRRSINITNSFSFSLYNLPFSTVFTFVSAPLNLPNFFINELDLTTNNEYSGRVANFNAMWVERYKPLNFR